MDSSWKTSREDEDEDSMNDWADEVKQIEGINGDRRSDRRYAIHLDLRWKLIRRRRVLDNGVGHTVDLSSGGILFDAGRQLPLGLNVELSISWPVLLRNVAPMQLIVSGRIVRGSQNRTAVAMAQHEFRTSGVTVEQRAAMNTPARTPSSHSSSATGMHSFR
jgi:PilZ domain